MSAAPARSTPVTEIVFPVISIFDPAVNVFCFSATRFVTVVAKFASSPIAAANSFSVSRSAGAESTRFATAVSVYDVALLYASAATPSA